MSRAKHLQPWQVLTGGICGLVLTIGLARFAYTPLLPSLQTQTGIDRCRGRRLGGHQLRGLHERRFGGHLD